MITSTFKDDTGRTHLVESKEISTAYQYIKNIGTISVKLEDLPKLLKEIRIKKKMKQGEFGKKVGLFQQDISHLETGLTELSFNQFSKIVNQFGYKTEITLLINEAEEQI